MVGRKRSSIVRAWVLVAACSITPRVARAADLTIPGLEEPASVHGFVSPGFLVSTSNNYLAHSARGSFEFTEVGLNLTVPLTEKLHTGVQLFAHKLGPIGNYSPKVDWFYLDYRFEDYFGLRAGRVKLPFGLYNDTSDIDVARVPILLPQSIYPLTSRDFLLAQTGGEAYGRVDMRSVGALEYRFYGGTIFVDVNDRATTNTQVTELDVPFVAGERVLWETPLDGLRFGGSLQALKLDTTFAPPNVPGQPARGPVSIGIPATLWAGSAEYSHDGLLLAAEYSRWVVRVDSSDPKVFPNGQTVSERGYVMGTYRVAPWFQPGAYYSLLFPDIHHRDGREHVQHDIAGTLRFDINTHWLAKLEGHFMSGTAALDTTLNDNKPLSSLAKNWGVFLIKTTAYF